MPSVDDVHEIVGFHMAELANLFQPEAKLTFIMRLPGNTESELFISDDNPADVAALAHRMIERDAKVIK